MEADESVMWLQAELMYEITVPGPVTDPHDHIYIAVQHEKSITNISLIIL